MKSILDFGHIIVKEDKVNIVTLIQQPTRVSGSMMRKMGSESPSGLTVTAMRGSMKMDSCMARVSCSMQMAQSTREISA